VEGENVHEHVMRSASFKVKEAEYPSRVKTEECRHSVRGDCVCIIR